MHATLDVHPGLDNDDDDFYNGDDDTILKAVLWLEHYLNNSFTGTLVLVSHDRAFLNDVATDIIHMADRKLKYYRGNYDGFEKILKEHTRNAIKRLVGCWSEEK